MINRKIFIKDLAFYINAESNFGLEKLRSYFKKNNHSILENEDGAEYIIINTFGYFDDISDKVINYVSYLKRNFKKSKIIIYGELVGISDKIDTLDVYKKIKIKEGFRLDEVFYIDKKFDNINSLELNQSKIVNPSDTNISYNINIMEGCSNNCAYCIMYKGSSIIKSRKIEDILSEFKYALSLSHIQINLIGDELGNYGKDIGTSFDKLLDELCSLEGYYNIRIEHIFPATFIEMFPKIRRNISKISSIFIPVVSFNNSSLKKLNRNYDFKDLVNILCEVKNINNYIVLENLILYDIPGETFKDFVGNFSYNNIFDRVVFRKYNEGYDNSKLRGGVFIDSYKKELFIKKLIKSNKEKYDLDIGVPYDLFKKSL